MLTKFLTKTAIAGVLLTGALVAIKHSRYKAIRAKEQALYDEAFKAVDGLAERVMANVKANMETVPSVRGFYRDADGKLQDVRSLNLFDLVTASKGDNSALDAFLTGYNSRSLDVDGDTHPGLGGAVVFYNKPQMYYYTSPDGVKWFARFDGVSVYYGSVSSAFNEEIVQQQLGVPKEHLKKTSEGYLYTN